MVKAVLAMLESTYRALCYSGADCLSGVGTYLPGSVLQWCRLFKGCRKLPAGHCVTAGKTVKRCRNLPAVHCVTVVKAVLAMSESTCRALYYSGKDCLRSVRTYLRAPVLQGCRLFQQCLNLPAGHCVAGLQTI